MFSTLISCAALLGSLAAYHMHHNYESEKGEVCRTYYSDTCDYPSLMKLGGCIVDPEPMQQQVFHFRFPPQTGNMAVFKTGSRNLKSVKNRKVNITVYNPKPLGVPIWNQMIGFSKKVVILKLTLNSKVNTFDLPPCMIQRNLNLKLAT